MTVCVPPLVCCCVQVLALAVNSGLVAFPTGYDTVWSAPGIHLWRPKTPEGYLALGCLATTSTEAPSLTAMVCLHRTLGVEAPLGQCLAVKQQEGSQALKMQGTLGICLRTPGPMCGVWTTQQPRSRSALLKRAPAPTASPGLPFSQCPECVCLPA